MIGQTEREVIMSPVRQATRSASVSIGDRSFLNSTYLDTLNLVDPTQIAQEHILTAILSLSMTISEAEERSAELLSELGSFNAVLAATRERINAITQLPPITVGLLRLLRQAVVIACREPLEHRPLLSDLSVVEEYLALAMAAERIETARVLYLDRKNYLIRDELHSTGSVGSTTVDVRKLVGRIHDLGASAIIVAHNHPSGDPSPSRDDCLLTADLADLLRRLDVTLHDHIIVGKHKFYSFRREGKI